MFRRTVAVLVGLSLAASAADLKYSKKIKDASGEHGAMTLYFQGQRVRIDHRNEVGYGWKNGRPENIYYGPRVATIYQCDMHRVLELDFEHHQYTVTELDRNGLPAAASMTEPANLKRSGVKVKVIVETRDTGETRQMFGYTARRFVTTRKEEPAAGACTSSGESVEDGWYIDIDQPQDSCMQLPKPPARARAVAVLAAANCIDDYEIERIGPQPPPFPVELTNTSKSAPNNFPTSIVVSDLSRLPLDPQIFDLPTGFKHVEVLDQSPSLPYFLRAKLMWQSVKSTVWGWTPWGR